MSLRDLSSSKRSASRLSLFVFGLDCSHDTVFGSLSVSGTFGVVFSSTFLRTLSELSELDPYLCVVLKSVL